MGRIANKRFKKAKKKTMSSKVCHLWTIREKLMILEYLVNNNNNIHGTAKQFDLEPKQICHIKRPSYSTVATWVRDSWDRVDVDLIKRSLESQYKLM
ncbi:25428_t:CDS:2, partial [Dentiscutata erythropus]